jgi:phage terminase small subunit
MAGLSPKQERFAQEYLIDLNATQAAIRAGYSPRSAKQQGARLLTKDDVQAAIQKGREEAQKRTDISLDRVLHELAIIAFADPRKAVKWGPGVYEETLEDGTVAKSSGVMLIDSDSLDDDVARTVAEVGNTKEGVKIKFHDKLAALEKLGKHLGLADRSQEKQTDRLTQAIIEISQRGSAAPITPRSQIRHDDDED